MPTPSDTLKKVVPWGRTYDEYRRMFKLTSADLSGRILGCGDGPASFNVEATERGSRVVSIDPIYRFSADEIRMRIDESRDLVVTATQQHLDDFIWDFFPNLDVLVELRMTAMEQFLSDYEDRRREGRYVAGSATQIPFGNRSFDIALVSHFLFLYSDQLNFDYHMDALQELRRVANEVRVFPLVDLNANPSAHVNPIIKSLTQIGFNPRIVNVPYEFVKGARQMLVF